jgi:hypothetical protein
MAQWHPPSNIGAFRLKRKFVATGVCLVVESQIAQ